VPVAAGGRQKNPLARGQKVEGLRGGNFLPPRLKFGGVFLEVDDQLIYDVVINDLLHRLFSLPKEF